MSTPRQDVGLESRLRGLILKNEQAQGEPEAQMRQTIPQNNGSLQSKPNLQFSQPAGAVSQQSAGPSLPPHLKGATIEDQQTFFSRQLNNAPPQQLPNEASAVHPRKRLNQAQRRQMNAQLHIPIEPRPETRLPSPGRTYMPSTGQSTTEQSYQRQNVPSSNEKIQSHPLLQQHQSGFTPHRGGSYNSRPHQTQQMRGGYQNRWQPQSTGQQRGSNTLSQSQQSHYQPHGQVANQSGIQHRPLANQNRQLYQPGGYSAPRSPAFSPDHVTAQSALLDGLVHQYVPIASVDTSSVAEMEAFRVLVEKVCRAAISEYELKELGNKTFNEASVEIKCFGSMASGFATKTSDMDLALLSPGSVPAPDSGNSQIPRLLEKALLDLNFGARLLTKTRVPIIKLCQKPTEKLLQDLRANLDKWTSEGMNGEEIEDDLEENAIGDAGGDDDNQPKQVIMADEATTKDSGTLKKLKKVPTTNDERLAMFKQKTDESHGDYYSSAKQLLRKLGGKDVHASHTTVLSPTELHIMSSVCKAFVNGLIDDSLKSRLSQYPSMYFGSSQEGSPPRSLSGVYTQIEGERLMRAAESLVGVTSEATLMTFARFIENWQKLCNRTDLDPLAYNRYLFQNVEQMRKVPLLQLAVLEQGQAEDPDEYRFRTMSIMRDLQTSNLLSISNAVEPTVTRYYIAGVRLPTIQQKLQSVLGGGEASPSLETVTKLHQMFALAQAYETALQSGKFSEPERVRIKQYLERLLGSSVPSVKSDPELASVLQTLSTLPEPTSNSKSRSRDRYHDALEFPKDNIGIQCDINFSAELALHNTLLLRCYAMTDPRVTPLVLFVKKWAKNRGINTPYRGTLSSYGYVLMVLHFLVNVANPFVCPNLQGLRRDPPDWLSPAEKEAQTVCQGKDVRFWRNEKEIANLSQRGMLNHNKDSVGFLLRGFFEYYAQNGQMSTCNGRGFDWGREVLSLRTPGGVLTKQSKGWVGARTDTVAAGDVKPEAKVALPTDAVNVDATIPAVVEQSTDSATPTSTTTGVKKKVQKEETKEIRHRYLFALEDPFELDHNVARTVTHLGIVSIRDEFRRAWRLIREAGRPTAAGGQQQSENLMDEAVSTEWKARTLKETLEYLHGTWEQPGVKAQSA